MASSQVNTSMLTAHGVRMIFLRRDLQTLCERVNHQFGTLKMSFLQVAVRVTAGDYCARPFGPYTRSICRAVEGLPWTARQ